jgi:hypothetical protein
VRTLATAMEPMAGEAVWHELWTASDPGLVPNLAWNRLHQPKAPLVHWWYVLNIPVTAANLFFYVGAWLLPQGYEGDLLRAAIVVALMAVDIAWATAFLRLIRQISSNQQRARVAGSAIGSSEAAVASAAS